MTLSTMELHITLMLILIAFCGYLVGYFAASYKMNPEANKKWLFCKWVAMIICLILILGVTQSILKYMHVNGNTHMLHKM